MIKVYGDLLSGNCYKVKLILHMLDIEHEWIHVDIMNAETQTEEFKAINPNAKVPALLMEDGAVLWESNAILNYLADGTAYLPSKKLVRSQVLQWQFFEQYSHEPNVAVARYIKLYLGLPEDRLAEFAAKKTGAYKALDVMEAHLVKNNFFAADMFTIADISLYAYTHVAADGEIDLSTYPEINAWMQRIEAKLKHKTMQDFINQVNRKAQIKERAELRLKEKQVAAVLKEAEQKKAEAEAKAKTAELDKAEEKPLEEISIQSVASAHDYFLTDIDGHELNLSDYENQVVLVVNVASECGLTPQYAGLQKLYERFNSQGFNIIAMPCNQFGAQEPGSELEIKRFCDLRFKTTFPMTSKIEVNGIGRHPLYDFLTGDDAKFPGDITWNFEKFLIAKNGQVIKRFAPATEPEDPSVVQAIEQALS